MAGSSEGYSVEIESPARRQLSSTLPEEVAAAAFEFINGALTKSPHRVGKRLQPPLADRFVARRGTYRVLYRIDDAQRRVVVLTILHRRDAYRPQR